MFILRRETLEELAKTVGVCASGLERHKERAKEQEGVDFGNGVVGNGVDTYYPNGLNDEEYMRIAEHDAQHAAWLITQHKVIGAPPPSPETFRAVGQLLRQQRVRRGR